MERGRSDAKSEAPEAGGGRGVRAGFTLFDLADIYCDGWEKFLVRR